MNIKQQEVNLVEWIGSEKCLFWGLKFLQWRSQWSPNSYLDWNKILLTQCPISDGHFLIWREYWVFFMKNGIIMTFLPSVSVKRMILHLPNHTQRLIHRSKCTDTDGCSFSLHYFFSHTDTDTDEIKRCGTQMVNI